MHVLVCDDDPEVGAFLRTNFELEGWTAALVTSGEECLETIDLSEPPDALVLDQVMPGLTGLETASKLREEGFAPPIVLCSGHLGPELTQEIERLELLPINKLDMDAVVRVVRAAARQHRRPVRRP